MAVENDGHPFQKFLAIVEVTAEQFGVPASREVWRHYEALRSAVEKHIVDTTAGSEKKQKIIELERRKFIAVFKARYLQLTDLEFSKMVTPVDARVVTQTVKQLMDKGFTADEYLRWAFEEFYPANSKFCPPSIKQSCSSFILERFFYENVDIIKARNEEKRRNELALDLINRSRILMRERPDDDEWKKNIKKMLTDFKERRIILAELKKMVVGLEKKIKAEKAKGG